jgi:hypothetical protein
MLAGRAQRSWYGTAVGIEGNQLGCAGRLSASLVGELRPQIGLVGPQQRRGGPAVGSVGNAPKDDPSLDRLGVNADLSGDLGNGEAGTGDAAAQSLVRH